MHFLQQAQLQAKPVQQPLTSKEIEINVLANKLRTSAQQFQAAGSALLFYRVFVKFVFLANAKQQQQQRLASGGSNPAIISLLNSSPASSINADASTAVVNAINNSSILPHVALNQKARKVTLANVNSARVINHSNLLVNNNRMNVMDFNAQQGQTITLNPNSNFGQGNFTLKQSVNRSDESALSALLVGTPAADRPDIVSPNTNSLFLEKLTGSSSTNSSTTQSPTHFIQTQKSPSVISPLSSPPPQTSNTINVQSLNFTPLQNISGLQNVQVQLPGFSQPLSLSLNVSSTGGIQRHPTSLIVSLPVTTATATCTTVTQQTANSAVTAGNTIGVGTPTVVLGGAGSPTLGKILFISFYILCLN